VDQHDISGDEPADPAEDLFCAVKKGRCSHLDAAIAGRGAVDEWLSAGALHLSGACRR